MPVDAVWIVITIPRKEYEKELNERKKKNLISNDPNYFQIDSNKNDSQIQNNLEKTVDDCLRELQVAEVVWVPSKNGKFYQIYFTVDLYDNDATLRYLQERGIGVRKETSVGYIPFGLFYCNEDEEELEEEYNEKGDENGKSFNLTKNISSFKKMQQDFLKSVTSRLTVIQVVEGVRSSAMLTFDFVMYTIFAGFIAAAGLLNNSPVDIAAAMMIEPVMATVMAMTFGLVIHDKSLFLLGAKNCFISLVICFLTGFIYGLIFLIWSVEWNPPPNGIWPTGEMQVRGLWRTLIYGALQAMAAGGAVAVSLLNNNQAALVGVAVASTFLPPFINTGLLWAYSAHLQMRGLKENFEIVNISGTVVKMKPSWIPQEGYQFVFHFDMRDECLALGGVSLIYTMVNVVCMLVIAYIILRFKEVLPLGKMEANRRFFKEDIKIARDYNRRSKTLINQEQLGEQILNEWAEIAGLDPKEFLSEKPEAEVTRLQTLKDIIEDVEDDEVYRSVTRSAVGRPYQANMIRRLTQANIRKSGRANSNVSREDINEIWDVEKSVTKKGRSFSVYPPSRRKDSKWNIDQISTQDSTIGSNQRNSLAELSVRGLKPSEIEARDRRRSSVAFRRTLQDSEHSPFSMWPNSRSRSPTQRFQVNEVRRRLSQVGKLPPQPENTRF
ncbi:hypothetical protein B4U79_08841 [Dinothrombium tinctorium]|uniref:Uncharacterized protein n=1 Tax=Dinothrombium tinctorium TaxID=1965070 RepID=A0A3S3NZX8_9ACAR|nr:hypothetical protein B4U79_11325 [Dinothrombium tinctorium]RWS05675.1 hypothetical protein B4U79_08841 [Dinothrombium tinctorium]